MPQGCRCPACYGLAEYMLAVTGRDYGLPPAPGHHTSDSGSDGLVVCDGGMTCECAACVGERRVRVLNAHRPAPRQPWEIRRAA